MQTAICDDIPKELEMIREALDAYTEKRFEYHFDIDEYSTAADVLSAVEKGKTYDIALLDICMPGILGTDAAEEMLAKSPDMGVVFLTTSDEYAVTAFALNATHYFLKPFSQKPFNAAPDHAVKITGNTMEMQGGVPIPIPGRSSEEVQKTYMEFCWKEVLK